MSRQFKNPFKFDANTRFPGFSSGTVKPGADSPFVLDFKSRARPIHSNQELPVFSVEGGWGADRRRPGHARSRKGQGGYRGRDRQESGLAAEGAAARGLVHAGGA